MRKVNRAVCVCWAKWREKKEKKMKKRHTKWNEKLMLENYLDEFKVRLGKYTKSIVNVVINFSWHWHWLFVSPQRDAMKCVWSNFCLNVYVNAVHLIIFRLTVYLAASCVCPSHSWWSLQLASRFECAESEVYFRRCFLWSWWHWKIVFFSNWVQTMRNLYMFSRSSC